MIDDREEPIGNEDAYDTSSDSVDNNDRDLLRVWLSPDELNENDWNPNEMSEKEYELLKDHIHNVGFIDPITAVEVHSDDGNSHYRIIGGAHRWAVAKELGLKEIPVDLLSDSKWKDEDLQKFQTVRLNVIHGKMKPEKFVPLYEEMAKKYGADKITRLMGYTKEDGIKKMIKQVAKSMEESLPGEMSEQFQEQAREARTVSDLEKIIQKLFGEHGDTMKYNFMVFAWGGREHIYVAMSKRTREAMKKIMKASKSNKVDVNEIVGDAIESAAKSVSEDEDVS